MLEYPVSLLARILDAQLRGPGEAVVRRVSTDSRKIEPGDLFVALSGERFDAHNFVPAALEQGAVAAVVTAGRLGPGAEGKGALIEVPDPLLALGQLAAWHRNRLPVRIVGITGSVGKTTTKDLTAAVLAQQWVTHKNPGNLNAEIGLPLTLLELRPEHQVAVIEMAMRGPGQIRYLARIARPEAAVFTNIGYSHMELLGSRDAIAAAKAEILDFLPNGGAAILNADDEYYPYLKGRVLPGTEVRSFGTKDVGPDGVLGAYLGPGPRPQTRGPEGGSGTRFTLRGGRDRNVRWAWTPLLGRHNMHNALAAAAAGAAMGVSWPRVLRGLAEAEVSGMRMTVHRLRDGSLLLDDAYNASSPDAMLGALEVLSEQPGLRKIAVLGSMLELGDATEEAHRGVGQAVAALKPSFLVTVGDKAALIAEAAAEAGYPAAEMATCADNDAALATLATRRRPGDVILVKGSRGVAMEGIVRGLTGSGEA